MLSAVTLSRSPPRADTTMMATDERSRICRHSSKPSTSGSMRSSSTMSGCSVSSRASALLPSVDTNVSKPRTARLDLIRSTMLGSSSTMSTRVGIDSSVTRIPLLRQPLLHRKRDPEAGAPGHLLKLHPAAVRGHDPAGDGQAEPRARHARAGPSRAGSAGRLRGAARDFWRHAVAVVGHLHRHHSGTGDLRRHLNPGLRRVVPERVAKQVDEDLLKAVMVGPDGRQAGGALDLYPRHAARRQAGDRGVEHQRDIAPVALQPEDA